MGNLGPYQDIVTEARRLGGVEQLIESVEKAAMARAMPKAFAAGMAVTAVGAAGVAAIIKRISKRAEVREAEADEAKARLTRELEEPSPPDTGFKSADVENDDGDGAAATGAGPAGPRTGS